jgi:hypothetical protein
MKMDPIEMGLWILGLELTVAAAYLSFKWPVWFHQLVTGKMLGDLFIAVMKGFAASIALILGIVFIFAVLGSIF